MSAGRTSSSSESDEDAQNATTAIAKANTISPTNGIVHVPVRSSTTPIAKGPSAAKTYPPD